MKERALRFGETQSLLAITTEPPQDAAQDLPGVILVSAGLVHRVGPNRLYVKIARRLASAGFPVLRFDLSGIGDSRARRDNVSIDERAVLETREAMDYLTKNRDIRRFVLVGLCSGADDAFRTALKDSRVLGLGMIDPCLYPSMGHSLRAYAGRLIKPRSWLDLVTGRSDLWRIIGNTVRARSGKERPEAAWDWKQIPADEFREGLVSMADRGTKLLLVYSPENSAYYNYRKHVRQQLGHKGLPSNLRVECIRGADHTFTQWRHQAALLDVAEDWARKVAGRHGIG